MKWIRLADSLGWSDGHSGKGYLLHDGTIKTWSTDPYHPKDQHEIWVQNNELSPIALSFEIDPDGGIVTDAPTTKVESLVQADPRLYDAGQRPVFEDNWDLDNFEPTKDKAGSPDFNFIMSSESLLPIQMNQGCPRCHGRHVDPEVGECLDCGYVIPYDGWEQMQGYDSDGPVPGWKATGWGTALDEDDVHRADLGEPHYGAARSHYNRWSGWQERERSSAWHFADYEGSTNWDTWNTKLMMDNEEPLYRAVRKLIDRGATIEQVRDWAIRKVIGPYNKERIQEAQEWNAIDPDERRRMKDESDHQQFGEQATEMGRGILDAFGLGNDPGDDDTAEVIDPEMVNWDEIYQDLKGEVEENANYDREMQQRQEQGIGWATNHDEATNRMRDAMYRYHGAVPEEDIQAELGPGYHGNDPRQYHNRKVNVPLENFQQLGGWPENYLPGGADTARSKLFDHRYKMAEEKAKAELLKSNPNLTPEQLDEAMNPPRGSFRADLIRPHFPGGKYDTPFNLDDPTERSILETDPLHQQWAQQGYNRSLSDHTWDTIADIRSDRSNPYTPQMVEALQQRGYTPEQIQQYMTPQWQWDEQLQKMLPVNREAPVEQWQQEQRADQTPGDFTFPQDWTARVAMASNILAPAVELREWLADLGGAESPPSIHHDTPEDTVLSPSVSTADDLAYFPPANIPKEYRQASEASEWRSEPVEDLYCPQCGSAVKYRRQPGYSTHFWCSRCGRDPLYDDFSSDLTGNPEIDHSIYRGIQGTWRPRQEVSRDQQEADELLDMLQYNGPGNCIHCNRRLEENDPAGWEDTPLGPLCGPCGDLVQDDRQASVRTADSPITQADATNDPLGKNPAIIPSPHGDPDYLTAQPCPHCHQEHRPGEPCPTSAVTQFKQMQQQWADRDPNSVHRDKPHGPGPGPSGLDDQQMDLSRST